MIFKMFFIGYNFSTYIRFKNLKSSWLIKKVKVKHVDQLYFTL